MKPAEDLGLPRKERLRSTRRESSLIDYLASNLWWTFIRTYLKAGHRLRIEGRKHLPADPPFIIVANHSSHLDVFILAAQLPWKMRDVIFPIAAGDTFFETPIATRFAATFLNALPMWRHRTGPQALKDLRRRLQEGPCAFILFPEGTRSRNGHMAPFKPGLGMLVAETNIPVVPCHIEGAFEAWPPHHRWPRFRKVSLRIGQPMTFGSLKNCKENWKEIARQTEEAVREAPSFNGSKP